jgi:hypothetical protein
MYFVEWSLTPPNNQRKKKKKVTWKEIDRASKEMLTGYM